MDTAIVTVLAFLFRYALRILIAWIVLGIFVSWFVGSMIRKMGSTK